MTKFVDGEQIAFRKHVLNIKHLTKVIDDLSGIFQCKLSLLDKTFGRIDADGDSFSMVTSILGEALDELEITNCVCEKLHFSPPSGRAST